MKRSAAVLGGVSWNEVVDVPSLPLHSTATVMTTGSREGIGSTGAGKALNLAALGFDVRLHCLLGDDAYGARARVALAAAGVDVTWWPDPRGTERHWNLLDPQGRRLSVFANPATPDPGIPGEELARFLSGADVAFVNLAEYARAALPHLAGAGVAPWVDVHDWDGQNAWHRDFVHAARVLTMSDEQLDDPVGLARHLACDKEIVVVTHGSRGATAVMPGHEPLHVPALPVEQVGDTNGAGDAFCAGMALGRLQGRDWPASLRLGAEAAARCVQVRGLAPDSSSRLAPADGDLR